MRYHAAHDYEKVSKIVGKHINQTVGLEEGKYFSLKPTLDLGKHFNLIYGNRSSGKTVAVLCHIVREAVFKGRMFCYLRTHENALNVVRRGVFETATKLLKVDRSSPISIVYDNGGYFSLLYDDGKEINRLTIGYCMSLNAVEQFKSNASIEDCRNIVYEECQPEGGINDVDIGRMLPSLYSSIDRNRRDTSLFALANLIGGAVPLSNVFGLTRRDIDQYHTMNAGVMVPSNEEVSLTKVFLDLPVEKTSLSAFRGNRYVEEAGLNKSFRNEGVGELTHPLPEKRRCSYVFCAERVFYGYEALGEESVPLDERTYAKRVSKILSQHTFETLCRTFQTAYHQELAEDYYHTLDNSDIVTSMYSDYRRRILPYFDARLKLVDTEPKPPRKSPLEGYIFVSRDKPDDLSGAIFMVCDELDLRRLRHAGKKVKMIKDMYFTNVLFDSIQAYEDFSSYAD